MRIFVSFGPRELCIIEGCPFLPDNILQWQKWEEVEATREGCTVVPAVFLFASQTLSRETASASLEVARCRLGFFCEEERKPPGPR